MTVPTKTIVLAELWRRYKRTGDRDARDQLILAYSPLVKYLAGRVVSGMPAHVDVADLTSFGLGGLINAVERYDPATGVQFEAYARKRIRGAIFDQLRSQDWVPRSVRAEAKRISAATATLCTRFQRSPSEKELAAELALSAEELGAALVRVDATHVVALDERAGSNVDGSDGASFLDLLADPNAIDPAASADAGDLRARIAVAVALLPAREQQVLALRYDQRMGLDEIGEILGVTGSRVCQIHAKAVIQLRELVPRVSASAGNASPVTA